MLYTEEVKETINKAGFQVVEFKNFIRKIHKAWNSLKDVLAEMARSMGNLIRKVVKAVREVCSAICRVIPKSVETLTKNAPPKQRYKFVRKLGETEYLRIFRRRHIYRIRSCC